MQTHGGLDGSGSHKVVGYIEEGSIVDLARFEQVLEHARALAIEQNAALKAL